MIIDKGEGKGGNTHIKRRFSKEIVNQLICLKLSVQIRSLARNLQQIIPQIPRSCSGTPEKLLEEGYIERRIFAGYKVDEGVAVLQDNLVLHSSVKHHFRDIDAAVTEDGEMVW